MIKECIVCIVSIMAIILGNNMTQNYSNEVMDNVLQEISNLKIQIINNEDNEKLKSQLNKIEEKWSSEHSNLAYFLEHDELEKIETSLTKLKTNIEIKNYSDATVETDEEVYLINHLKEKNTFNLENIF